jgi:hypothetical protein
MGVSNAHMLLYIDCMINRYAAALGRIGVRVRMQALAAEKRRQIANRARATRLHGALPESLRALFPERPFETLLRPRLKSLLMLTVLTRGTSEQVEWLGHRFGPREVHRWLRRRRGRGLTVEQMLPWVPAEIARRWLTEGAASPIASRASGPSARKRRQRKQT